VKFLLDESTNYLIAPHLRQLGHEVTAVGQDYPGALKDSQVLAIAERERRVVIANDRDFGELVVVHGQPHAGVFLLRLGPSTTAELIERVVYVITLHTADLDQLLVVTRQSVRVRRIG